jgi:hypothetical protein
MVMIRPERIGVTVGQATAHTNVQPGKVSEVVFSGEKVSLFVETEIGLIEPP